MCQDVHTDMYPAPVHDLRPGRSCAVTAGATGHHERVFRWVHGLRAHDEAQDTPGNIVHVYRSAHPNCGNLQARYLIAGLVFNELCNTILMRLKTT